MNEKEITLTLTVEDINGILVGLGKLPLEQSLGLFTKVKQQAEAQLPQAEPTVDTVA